MLSTDIYSNGILIKKGVENAHIITITSLSTSNDPLRRVT